MNLLYIHGLDSSPRPDKTAILECIATQVWTPQLDYRANNNIFNELLSMAITEKINFIVGSSAGGFMGYWLAKYLDCRALLFNPALAFQSVIQQVLPVGPENISYQNTFLQIILGAKDEVIPPKTTIDYLANHEIPELYAIEQRPELAHQIDLNTFESMCVKYIV